jgi:hypothetical protein
MKTTNDFLKSYTREAGVLTSAKRSSDELQESDKTKEPSPHLVALASPDGIPYRVPLKTIAPSGEMNFRQI